MSQYRGAEMYGIFNIFAYSFAIFGWFYFDMVT